MLTACVRSAHPWSKYCASLTEAELSRALERGQSSCGERVLVFIRELTDPPDYTLPLELQDIYYDVSEGLRDVACQGRLQKLKGAISCLMPTSVHRSGSLTLSLDLGMDARAHAEYIEQFVAEVCRGVVASLDKVEAQLAVEGDELVDVASFHLRFALDRAERFFDLDSSRAALAKVLEYLKGPGGSAFVVHGAS